VFSPLVTTSTQNNLLNPKVRACLLRLPESNNNTSDASSEATVDTGHRCGIVTQASVVEFARLVAEHVRTCNAVVESTAPLRHLRTSELASPSFTQDFKCGCGAVLRFDGSGSNEKGTLLIKEKVAVSILDSGKQYSTGATLFSRMDMPFMSKSYFYGVQKDIVIPAVEKVSRDNQLQYRTMANGDSQVSLISDDVQWDHRRHGSHVFHTVMNHSFDEKPKIMVHTTVSRHRGALPERDESGNFPDLRSSGGNYYGTSGAMSGVAAERSFQNLLDSHPQFSTKHQLGDGDDQSNRILKEAIEAKRELLSNECLKLRCVGHKAQNIGKQFEKLAQSNALLKPFKSHV
jgi:hypothetical protein